jgi:hypothetical protein
VPGDDPGGVEVAHGEHVGIAVAREVTGVPQRPPHRLALVDRQRPDHLAQRHPMFRGTGQLGDRQALAARDPVRVGACEDHRLDAAPA